MKRDWDLIREILLRAEETTPTDAESWSFFHLPNRDERLVAYHVQLLIEAGLLRGNVVESEQTGPIQAYVERLTWSGHDFLDAAKNPTVWHRVTAFAREKGGSVTFELLKTLLVEGLKALLTGKPLIGPG